MEINYRSIFNLEQTLKHGGHVPIVEMFMKQRLVNELVE
jgi:hypothetical protein